MASSSTARAGATRARERARAQLADRLAATRAKEQANEDDLVAFFAAAEEIARAAEARDDAVAVAQRTYDAAVASSRQAQQATVRSLRERGETIPDIASLTGWTHSEIRKATITAVNAAATTPADTNSGAPDDTDGGEDAVVAGG